MPRQGMARFFSPRPIPDSPLRQRFVDLQEKRLSPKACFRLTKPVPSQIALGESGPGAPEGTRPGRSHGEVGGILPSPCNGPTATEGKTPRARDPGRISPRGVSSGARGFWLGAGCFSCTGLGPILPRLATERDTRAGALSPCRGRGKETPAATERLRSPLRPARSEVRGQRSEVRGRRSEVGGRRSEVRGRRSEVRGRRSVEYEQFL